MVTNLIWRLTSRTNLTLCGTLDGDHGDYLTMTALTLCDHYLKQHLPTNSRVGATGGGGGGGDATRVKV